MKKKLFGVAITVLAAISLSACNTANTTQSESQSGKTETVVASEHAEACQELYERSNTFYKDNIPGMDPNPDAAKGLDDITTGIKDKVVVEAFEGVSKYMKELFEDPKAEIDMAGYQKAVENLDSICPPKDFYDNQSNNSDEDHTNKIDEKPMS